MQIFLKKLESNLIKKKFGKDNKQFENYMIYHMSEYLNFSFCLTCNSKSKT